MPLMDAALFRIDPDHILTCLEEVPAKLNGAGNDVVLDFSSVHRLDTGGLRALEKLAGIADDKGIKISLFNVGVEVYKVLKLMKVSTRFSYLS